VDAETLSRSRCSPCTKLPSSSTCYPESRRRALVSRVVRERLRWSVGSRNSGFRTPSLDPGTSIRFKLPAWIFFPLSAQICPVRIFRQNEFQLFCPTPAFDLDLSHSCADDVCEWLTPDQHVELVSRGEAIRIEFVLMLEYAIRQFAGEANIQPSRLV
jgi:hypothetical protein